MKYCPVINNDNICDLIENINDINDIDDNIIEQSNKYNFKAGEYISLYGGMGSTYFIRKNKHTAKLEYFFMHSDSWGQYGEDSSDIPKLNAFLYKYNFIDIIANK